MGIERRATSQQILQHESIAVCPFFFCFTRHYCCSYGHNITSTGSWFLNWIPEACSCATRASYIVSNNLYVDFLPTEAFSEIAGILLLLFSYNMYLAFADNFVSFVDRKYYPVVRKAMLICLNTYQWTLSLLLDFGRLYFWIHALSIQYHVQVRPVLDPTNFRKCA